MKPDSPKKPHIKDASKPGRPRNTALRKKILDAALFLLQRRDLSKVSVEAIAARAKVGKATVYRWWPNKSAVIMEAFLDSVAPSIKYAQTEDPLDDIYQQMRGLSRSYGTAPGHIFLHLIAQAQFDEELSLELAKYVGARRQYAKAAIKRAIKRNLLRADIDIDVALDQLYAPIFYRLLVGYAEVNDEFLTETFEQVLRGIR